MVVHHNRCQGITKSGKRCRNRNTQESDGDLKLCYCHFSMAYNVRHRITQHKLAYELFFVLLWVAIAIVHLYLYVQTAWMHNIPVQLRQLEMKVNDSNDYDDYDDYNDYNDYNDFGAKEMLYHNKPQVAYVAYEDHVRYSVSTLRLCLAAQCVVSSVNTNSSYPFVE